MFRPEARSKKHVVGPFDKDKLYELEELGLYIADDDSLMIRDEPGEKYRYRMKKATDSLPHGFSAEDYNDSFWFAVTKILAGIVKSRLADLGVFPLPVPLSSSTSDPHTSIYVSNGYQEKETLVIAFPDGGEAGIWTGRLVSQQSIKEGSLEMFVRLFKSESTGVVIANPSQLIWDGKEAMSHHQFICSGGRRIGKSNKIPEHENQQAHIDYVLSKVLRSCTAKKLCLVAVGYSAYTLLRILNDNWSIWKDRVSTIALISSCHSKDDIDDPDFSEFFQQMCVQFCASELPLKTLVQDDRFGLTCVSGGHEVPEGLPATCLSAALEFINHINSDAPFQIVEPEHPPSTFIWDDNMSNVLSGQLPPREIWGDALPETHVLTPEETRKLATGLPDRN